MSVIPYHKTYLRTLLDMHIPDWDDEFLSQYDPVSLAETYARAGIEGVLFYTKSHIGLAYYPKAYDQTSVHKKARNRDLVGELFGELVKRNMRPAAYHTVVFDNHVVLTHPEWRTKNPAIESGADPADIGMGARYGTASYANRDYCQHEVNEITRLLELYDFDAIWIDMVWTPGIDVSESVRDRYREETGHEIPTVVDWTDPNWVEFEKHRKTWTENFVLQLKKAAQKVRPNVAFTHNIGPGTHGWINAQNLDFSQHDTFAAGDLYGGQGEQLLMSKLLLHIGEEQPAEFMTSRTVNLHNHVALKSEDMMLTETLATILHDSAFLFIDAIDVRGTFNQGVYERIGRIYSRAKEYSKAMGPGEPVEDIMIYYSDDSTIDPAVENGANITEVMDIKFRIPHRLATTGAALKLSHAHVPFGVFTKWNLARLSSAKVLLLCDVIRITMEEVEAFRKFVRDGGQLYASGRTSILQSDGSTTGDFLLSDVLGVSSTSIEDGELVYMTAEHPDVAAALAPESFLGLSFSGMAADTGPAFKTRDRRLAIPRLATKVAEGTQILGKLNLPYAYPAPGTCDDKKFASIHSSPPFTSTDFPALVQHAFGKGQAVYSVSPIESGTTVADERLFVTLIRKLLPDPTFTMKGKPTIWTHMYHQPIQRRYVFGGLDYITDYVPDPTDIEVTLKVPEKVTSVETVHGEAVKFELKEQTVVFNVKGFKQFEMWFVSY